MVKKSNRKPLEYRFGVIGAKGYRLNDIQTLWVEGLTAFEDEGIVPNSMLVVDTSKPCVSGKINVYQKPGVPKEGEFQLSKSKTTKLPYVGRVVMAVNQY